MLSFEDDYTITKNIEMTKVINRIFWPILYKIHHNFLSRSKSTYEEEPLEEFKKKFSIEYGYGRMFSGPLGNYNNWIFRISPKDFSYFYALIEYNEFDTGKKRLKISHSIFKANEISGVEKLFIKTDLIPLFDHLKLGQIDVEVK